MTGTRKVTTGMLLCFFGLLGNILSLPLFEGFNYLFGSIPVFIALRLLGIGWAFVVAVVASSWVNVLFWHPNAMIWLSLEPVFVGLMIRHTRIKNIVVWDAVYWPLLGNVILWIVFQYVMGVPVTGTVGAMLMFWIIGINNALVAELIIDFLPVVQWMGTTRQKKRIPLNRILFSLSTTMVWIPVFLIMMINGQRISSIGKELIISNLQNATRFAGQNLDQTPDLAALSPENLRDRFDWMRFGGFSCRFTLADADGMVLASTKPDIRPGIRYGPDLFGVCVPVTETICRVVPRPEQKVPRWRLAQLSFFAQRIALQNGHRLFVEIPFTSFQSWVLKQQVDSLIVLLVADLVILAVSLLFSRTLSRTIVRLGDVTHNLPEKIYREEAAQWPETTIHEFSLLMENFRNMSLALREKFREITDANALLEERVRERTIELETINEELTTEIEHRKQVETERHYLEERVKDIEKMESLGRLAGGVAHDFNNLLTPILGYADLLSNSFEEDHSAQPSLRVIYDAAGRAASLTRQILAFSRRQVLEFETVDLNSIIQDFSDMLKRLIGEDITFCSDLSPEPALIMADVSQIQQILMNLVVNARDAMPSGGRLVIQSRHVLSDEIHATQVNSIQPGPYVRVSVSDTGCGMEPDTVKHIFEPFFTTKDAARGTGLGLATVYGIIRQHRGTVEVFSEPGRGTVFQLFFPVTTELQQRKSRPSDTGDMGGNETILVVEDSDMVRSVVRSILEKNGYSVMTAASSEEALALLNTRKERVDLLLTDVILPNMNGLELHRAASRIVPDLRVLFMSGYTADVITEKTMMADDVTILQKPLSRRELLAGVGTVLNRPQGETP